MFIRENQLNLGKSSEILRYLSYDPAPPSLALAEWEGSSTPGGMSRRWNSLPPQIILSKGSEAVVSHLEGQTTCISHTPQPCVTEAKFQASMNQWPGAPFLHPASLLFRGTSAPGTVAQGYGGLDHRLPSMLIRWRSLAGRSKPRCSPQKTLC